MVYKWKDGSRFRLPAQVVGEELERIGAANDGQVAPAEVVEAARPEEAPLHVCFEWDDEVAAELYREDQARAIIRSVVFVERIGEDDPPRVVQAYVHVDTCGGDACYLPTAIVMSDAELRDQVLADALALLRGVQRRFEHLGELREVFDAIEAFAARQRTHGRERRQPRPQRQA